MSDVSDDFPASIDTDWVTVRDGEKMPLQILPNPGGFARIWWPAPQEVVGFQCPPNYVPREGDLLEVRLVMDGLRRYSFINGRRAHKYAGWLRYARRMRRIYPNWGSKCHV